MESLSAQQARSIVLSQQGLLEPLGSSAEVIEQLGYIQIDTISVTERAHHHVLFSRNRKYQQAEIEQLISSKQVFEYWSHAAAYLPMCDFRYSLYKKEQYRQGEKHWFDRNKKVELYVMDRIRSEGPLQSKDFESAPSANAGGWDTWKPTKVALSNLFIDGSLMITGRQGFQKIFDLSERVIPAHLDTSVPDLNQYAKYLINSALQAQGLMCLNEIIYLRKGIKNAVIKQLQEGLEAGEYCDIQIENSDVVYYAFSQTIEHIALESSASINNKQVHLLSPFDNMVIQRKRLEQLFDFQYQIECYVPKAKRQYGYYCIPVLYGDRFVARFDAKANRKTGEFDIHKIWYEADFKITKEFEKKFNRQLKLFQRFCGC